MAEQRKDLGFIAKRCLKCNRITDHRCEVEDGKVRETCINCRSIETRSMRPEDLNVA